MATTWCRQHGKTRERAAGAQIDPPMRTEWREETRAGSETPQEDPLAALAGADHLPAGLLIEAVGAAARLGGERAFAMAGVAQAVERPGEQRAADAAAFVRRIDEQ